MEAIHGQHNVKPPKEELNISEKRVVKKKCQVLF
jgi:hypothetical protein